MYNGPRTKVATGNPDVIQFGSLDRDNVFVRAIRAHILAKQLDEAMAEGLAARDRRDREMAERSTWPALVRRQAE